MYIVCGQVPIQTETKFAICMYENCELGMSYHGVNRIMCLWIKIIQRN